MKGKGFILRKYRKGDEESLRKSVNNKKIYKNTANIPHPYSKKDAKDFINLNIKENKKRKKTNVRFAIDINGEAIGCVGIHIVESHKAEIGYWLAEQYWGKGIMTQALKLMTNYGFKKLKLVRIYATIFSGNKASARVAEKAGYKFEGLLKKYHKKKGKYIDAMMHAKVR